MLEVALAGEDHGEALFVGRPDHLVVTDAPAGLNDRRRTPPRPLRRGPSRNGKKASLAHAPPARSTVGLLGRDAPGISAVLLAGADADSLLVLDQHDRVRG